MLAFVTSMGKARPWYRRKRSWSLAFLGLVLITWLGRESLLRRAGYFLICDDGPRHGDALYVLGGAAFDRGTRAAELLHRGVAPVAYCTGSTISQNYKAEGRELTEADLTRLAAVRAGASPLHILPLPYGTSTFEEAQGVLFHARSIKADTIIVLSTDFHTRRVGNVFRKRFKGSGIQVWVMSAPSTEYETDGWWKTEQGLLMVNNEYVKTLFYLLKR